MYVFSTPFYAALNTVSLFSMDATTGRLAALPPRLAADEDFWPGPLALHPDGQFAYVQNSRFGAPSVGVFRIEADGGLARQIMSTPRPGLGGPIFDPTGRFAYLYDINTRVFHGFRVDAASGALVSIPGAELDVPDSAWQMVFRPYRSLELNGNEHGVGGEAVLLEEAPRALVDLARRPVAVPFAGHDRSRHGKSRPLQPLRGGENDGGGKEGVLLPRR